MAPTYSEVENENIDWTIVNQVATTLLKICKRDAQKSVGHLMINFIVSSMKITQEYLQSFFNQS